MLYDRIPYRLIKERPKGFTVVGAMDTPAKLRAGADYICTGTRTTGGDQNTINMALQEGKAVLLLPGTYWLSGSIVLDNNQMLIGSGMSTVVKLRDNHNADINLIYANGKSGVVIRDLVVDGNKENQSSGAMRCIYFYNVTNSAILFCYLLNAGSLTGSGAGIGIYNSNSNIILGNILIGHVGHGMVSNNSIKNIIIENIFKNNDQSGILNHMSSHYNIIIGNLFENNGYHGIMVRANYCVVKNNEVIGNQQHGIYLSSGSSHNIVSNNMLFGNGVENANTYDNIIIEGSYNSILSNVCRHNNISRYGIRISSSSYSNNIIHGNNLYSSGLSGDIYDAGTNTRKRDNIGNDGNWLTDA